MTNNIDTTITVRNVPGATWRRFKELAAERTKKEGGRRVVPVNELYVEALDEYASKG